MVKMSKDGLRSFIKDSLINNVVYDSYVDFNGNAITEIDYDKTYEGEYRKEFS